MKYKFDVSVIEKSPAQFTLQIKYLELEFDLPDNFVAADSPHRLELIQECFLKNFSMPLFDKSGVLELSINYDGVHEHFLCLQFEAISLYGAPETTQKAVFYNTKPIKPNDKFLIPNTEYKFDYLKSQINLPPGTLLWVEDCGSLQDGDIIGDKPPIKYYFKQL